MEYGGGHVVLEFILARKAFYGFEDTGEQVFFRFEAVGAAKRLEAVAAELFSVTVECFGEAVGAEEHGIAGLQAQRGHFVRASGE